MPNRHQRRTNAAHLRSADFDKAAGIATASFKSALEPETRKLFEQWESLAIAVTNAINFASNSEAMSDEVEDAIQLAEKSLRPLVKDGHFWKKAMLHYWKTKETPRIEIKDGVIVAEEPEL